MQDDFDDQNDMDLGHDQNQGQGGYGIFTSRSQEIPPLADRLSFFKALEEEERLAPIPKEGDSSYLISSKWYSAFREYSSADGGYISNPGKGIFSKSLSRMMQRVNIENKDCMMTWKKDCITRCLYCRY